MSELKPTVFKGNIVNKGIFANVINLENMPYSFISSYRALYNIGKRSFVPPTLKEKEKW